MPLNLLKVYNSLLEINVLSRLERTKSLKAIFNRDFIEMGTPSFNNKTITPTPADGIATMDMLFNYLTTKKERDNQPKRIFDRNRSIRLHWVKHHLDESKRGNILHFTVKEPQGFRTYI